MKDYNQTFTDRTILWVWFVSGGLFFSAALLLRFASPFFSYDIDLIDMPVLWLVAGYLFMGAAYVVILPYMIRITPTHLVKLLFIFMVLAGLFMRFSQFGVEPIIEDDFYRYLWDGALVNAGISPYIYAPESIQLGEITNPTLSELMSKGGHILERINYPYLRTVYPPVAQAAFSIANWISAFSLDSWRMVLFLCEIGTLFFIVKILIHIQKPILWAALYWWCPLVIKEVGNSAHMEPVLMFPVLAGVYLAIKGRGIASVIMLTIGAGVKIWPVIAILPVWKNLLATPKKTILGAIISLLILAVLIWPILISGLNESSGFFAFAQKWRASSGVILITDWLALRIIFFTSLKEAQLALISRGMIAVIFAVIMIKIFLSKQERSDKLLYEIFILISAIYILSPTQNPWYFLWIAPFLCFYPVRGLMLAGALIPMHYLYFYFAPRDMHEIYRTGIIWAIWIPVWILLIAEWRLKKSRSFAKMEKTDEIKS